MEEMLVGALIFFVGTFVGAFCHSAGVSAGKRIREEQ